MGELTGTNWMTDWPTEGDDSQPPPAPEVKQIRWTDLEVGTLDDDVDLFWQSDDEAGAAAHDDNPWIRMMIHEESDSSTEDAVPAPPR